MYACSCVFMYICRANLRMGLKGDCERKLRPDLYVSHRLDIVQCLVLRCYMLVCTLIRPHFTDKILM